MPSASHDPARRSRALDLRALAEALADVLAERGLLVGAPLAPPARVLDAAQVASLLGRDRHWVYDHAAELGAFRFGDGPRARLGFDRANVERWKREREIRNGQPRRRRRRNSRALTGAKLIPYEPPGG